MITQRGKPPTKIEVEAQLGRRPHVVITFTDAWVENHELVLSPGVARQLAHLILLQANMIEIRSVHEA